MASKYFCLKTFVELIKDKYPKVSKIVICFDSKKAVKDKIQSDQISSLWNHHSY